MDAMRLAFVWLVFLAGCSKKNTDPAVAADSEHRGIAIAPIPTNGPTIIGPGHRKTGAEGGVGCHMLDGTRVPSCVPGDALCTCN